MSAGSDHGHGNHDNSGKNLAPILTYFTVLQGTTFIQIHFGITGTASTLSFYDKHCNQADN